MTNFELNMPFVTVVSKGGPHDDESYVCGFEMGRLEGRLKSLNFITPWYKVIWKTKPFSFKDTLHLANKPQADLIAMQHGWTVQWENSEVEDWIYATFTYTKE